MAIEGTTGSQTCSREMTSSRAEKDNTDNKTETKTAAVAARGSTDTLSPGQDNKDNNEASHATLSILLIYCCCVFLRPCLLTNCLMGQSPWVSDRPYVREVVDWGKVCG